MIPEPSYSYQRELISPETAKEWLGRLGPNRVLSLQNVRRLSETLTGGRWNNDAPQLIIFDTDGFVRDGQNRLHAIVRSGVGIWAIVVRNMEPGAFAVLDTGKRRSAADTLHTQEQVQYANVVASACRYAQNYIDGVGIRTRRDNDEVLAFYRANPGMAQIAARAFKVNRVFGPSPFAAVMYLASRDRSLHKKIDQFIAGVANPSAVDMRAGDPRAVLREWASRQLSGKGQVIRPEPLMMAASRAWNAYASGSSVEIGDLRSSKAAHRDTMPITGFREADGERRAA